MGQPLVPALRGLMQGTLVHGVKVRGWLYVRHLIQWNFSFLRVDPLTASAVFEAPAPLSGGLPGNTPPPPPRLWPVLGNSKPPEAGCVAVWSPKNSCQCPYKRNHGAGLCFNAIPSEFARKNDWLTEREPVWKVASPENLCKKLLIPKSLQNGHLYA